MDLVSEEYKATLENTHKQTNHRWGQSAPAYTKELVSFIRKNEIKSLLDYGSAWGSLKNSFKESNILEELESFKEYDPGYPEKCNNNIPQEFVVCVDVLEHVEPELIENVLDDLQRCTERVGFFVIATRLAKQILSDGRNAHLIVQPREWWEPKISERFNILKSSVNGIGDVLLYVVNKDVDQETIQV
jgi:hypothetical protein